jgi:hypothetical protein
MTLCFADDLVVHFTGKCLRGNQHLSANTVYDFEAE